MVATVKAVKVELTDAAKQPKQQQMQQKIKPFLFGCLLLL
jgi:hypothetical protein